MTSLRTRIGTVSGSGSRTCCTRLSFYLVTSALLLNGTLALADATRMRVSQEQFEELRNKYSLVSWCFDERGVPEYLKGKLSDPGFGDSDAETVYRFLEENRDLFGMSEPRAELQLYSEEKDPYGNHHLRFRQIYQGLDVFTAEMLAHLNSTGMLKVITDYYRPDIAISTEPEIDEDKVREMALGNERVTDSTASVTSCDLVVFPAEDIVRLAWMVTVAGMPGSGLQFGIDANTGEVFRAVPTYQTTSSDSHAKGESKGAPREATEARQSPPSAGPLQEPIRSGTLRYVPNPARRNTDSMAPIPLQVRDTLDAIRIPKMIPLDESERPPRPHPDHD